MRLIAIVCCLTFLMAGAVSAQTAATLTADQLLQRGEESYRAGRYAAAIEDLRAAATALLSPEQKQQYVETGVLPTLARLEESLIYLAVSYNKVGKDPEARDAVVRLLNAERIAPTYSTLPLRREVAEFEPLVARLVPSASLTANVQLATGGATPAPVQVAASAPAAGAQPAPAAPPPSVATAPVAVAPATSIPTAIEAAASPPAPASGVTPPAAPPPAVVASGTPPAPATPAVTATAVTPPPAPTPPRPVVAQAQTPSSATPAQAALTPEQRAEVLRLVEERVAEARAQIEREAGERIAAVQREADERVARERQAAQQAAQQEIAAGRAAAEKAADERIAADRAALQQPAESRIAESPNPTPASAAPPLHPAPAVPVAAVDLGGDLLARLRDAATLATSGRIDDAIRLYAAVAASSTASREAIANAAIGLYRTGAFSEAVAAFERLGTLGRGEEDLRYYDAISLYETGHYREARREFACALPFIQVTDEVAKYQSRIELSAAQ